MLAKALNWSVRCWRTGLVPPAPCCARGWTRSGAMCSLAPSCMPTTRRFRCWHRAMARPKQHGCGPTCVTIAPPATPRRQRSGSPTRRTAKASIRKLTWPPSRACCRPMRMPVSMHCMSMARYRKRRVGHMHAASSTICMQPGHRPSRLRPCAGSPSSM
ncbi:hypothetical protein D3C81_1461400 [compost metagenome]